MREYQLSSQALGFPLDLSVHLLGRSCLTPLAKLAESWAAEALPPWQQVSIFWRAYDVSATLESWRINHFCRVLSAGVDA
jgi:hypothetical protein